MVKRGLIVVTSTQKYPTLDKATGLWLSEVTHFWNELFGHGWDFDFVSPRGGYTPIDPTSLTMAPDQVDWKWYGDAHFRKHLANTLKPEDVKAEHYDLIYYSGGHGTVFDFPDNKELQLICRAIWEKGGIVAGVCHGLAGLINVTLSNGEHLIKGKNITCFSNTEEQQIKLDSAVPYMLETELKNKGATYSCQGSWQQHVVVDGRLISGQNPASVAEIARAVQKL